MQTSKMKSLFLAWQAPSRAWFPIGLLNANTANDYYVFQYTNGALRAQKEIGFQPLLSFPSFEEKYEASELFPLFSNRVLGSSRKDFSDYLRSLDIDSNQADPIEILAVSGGERQTDNLEVFPKIEKKSDNSFSCRFFLHGLSHVSEEGQKRSMLLKPEEALQISLELNNPATKLAVQLSTKEYQFVGWAPRYLIEDILGAVPEFSDLSAKVVRVNDMHVPLNRRILIELSGHLPKEFQPMSSNDFQVIKDISSNKS